MFKNKKLWIGLLAVVAVIAVILLVTGKEPAMYAVPGDDDVYVRAEDYQAYLDQHGYEGKYSSAIITLDIFAAEPSEDAEITKYPQGVINVGMTMPALDTGSTGSVTWRFNVAKAGFYNIELGYHAMKGSIDNISRQVLIDGAVPYSSLKNLVFERTWTNEAALKRKDQKGAGEVFLHNTVYLEDNNSRISDPLAIYLTEGEHTITFVAKGEPLAITSLVLRAAPNATLEATYQAYLSSHNYSGELSTAQIDLDLTTFTAENGSNAQMTTVTEIIAKEDGATETVDVEAVDTGDTGMVTWAFTAEEAGFYNIRISYQALPGTRSDIQRRVLLDGEVPYSAMSQIVFKRIWQDKPIGLKNDNEIRPDVTEIFETQTVYLEDYDRRSGAPLLVYLSQGEHTLSLDVSKEPLAVTAITFCAAPETADYDEVLPQWKESTAMYKGDPIIAQAERSKNTNGVKTTELRTENNTLSIRKSSPSITIQKNYSDAALEPYHAWHILFPTIGASSWALPGDSITWEVEVPEDGLYVLTFKGRQTSRGVTSYRRLLVNGEVPYAEAEVIGFDYSGTMQNYTFADKDGNPFYIRLNKGSNTITLECVLGSVGGVLSQVEQSLRNLNALYLGTIQITGQVPSQFIDYEIATKIPNFVKTMTAESHRLYSLVDQIVAITGEKGENTAMLEKMAIQAEGLAKKPDQIIEELSQLKNNIAALGTWINNVSTMPLELDALIISSDIKSLPESNEGFFQGIWADAQRFAATFFNSTSSVVASDSGDNATREITVWMASAGREQAQIIQNMIDETFTPNSDIRVKLQLIPMDVVLRAALAGNGPDVVIGLGQTTAQDFAMRGATVDLSKLKGYDEYVKRYSPGVLRATTYNGGAYGIPEQVSFQMLFYRQDVLDELGIEKVPTTWTEVMELIPVLNRDNYEFYMPSTRVGTGLNLFQSMVYQKGGEIYKGVEGPNGTYGYASALAERKGDSDPAMEAFKWYTDLFTVHGLQVQADFNNRFRTGEMPMGVTDYTTYCTLEIFAPEIKGLWSFAPLPGTPLLDENGDPVLDENGEVVVDRRYVADTVQTVIMKGADDKDAAWEFVQWWNETAQQTSYAMTLEAIMGAAARYPAADPNVIANLPWSNQERDQLLKQYDALLSMPAVPGYYMNTRMISYAFEDVISDLANPRETLYLNIRDIDKELLKKREEFGLSTKPSVTENGDNTNE